ncbi:hypothetical protein B0A49_03398 [Cryomyces minteri]|uniref:Homeobox domain-containing protein n=1 Tax=Cryomyces minteri TaxID=331657 RepID=A0A4U0XMQ0_9PEZI|nr:hypothetical protein B0A49_03398 [Cryomyces minteri]
MEESGEFRPDPDVAQYIDFGESITSMPVPDIANPRDVPIDAVQYYGCPSHPDPASFSRTGVQEQTSVDKHSGKFLDTLHVVSEDVTQHRGTFTGSRTLKSSGGNITPAGSDDFDPASRKSGNRFPKAAVKVLKDWLSSHADRPYPTDEERDMLKKQTGLKTSQISDWLANARRRSKIRRPKRCTSPTLQNPSRAIDIPCMAHSEKPWGEMNPLERWQNSPPENEPASVPAIANAVATSEYIPSEDGTSPDSWGGRRQESSGGSSFSMFRAPPSTTSLETGISSGSFGSLGSAWSHGSRTSFGSLDSMARRNRRRRRHPAPVLRADSGDVKRIFQCTFCTDTFKSKYDWARHEKSLHLTLEKWICAPLGTVVTDVVSGQKKCVYCDTLDPSAEHLEMHSHDACEDKGIAGRTFYRKDHLRQHLNLVHHCAMIDSMNTWKSAAQYINSRCGFCGQKFTQWQDRVDHLAKHFRNGAHMKDWKGCRGLDPPVAAHVRIAMPPYLIGHERTTPIPFSAESRTRSSTQHPHVPEPWDPGSIRLSEPNACSGVDILESSDRATCWEILTVCLGQYAKASNDVGLLLTDEMLQKQARRILYEDEDAWNQTAADNPEWLSLFKKAHGLNYIPTSIGGQARDVPEDLEMLGHLGLRVPYSIQQGGSVRRLALEMNTEDVGRNEDTLTAGTACGDPMPDDLNFDHYFTGFQEDMPEASLANNSVMVSDWPAQNVSVSRSGVRGTIFEATTAQCSAAMSQAAVQDTVLEGTAAQCSAAVQSHWLVDDEFMEGLGSANGFP